LRSALFCFLSTFCFSRFEQWFFGFLEKYGKIKITRGLFALGVGEKAFHVVSFSGAWHFFEYEQRPKADGDE